MLTLNDFSFLIVSSGKDIERINAVYESIRRLYPDNEVVIVYDSNPTVTLSKSDDNLIEVNTDTRVYVSGGYNLALKATTKKCFVFLHDDTFIAENFLENILPHVTVNQFCNFTTTEPPLYGDPDSDTKPIKDFGRSAKTFNWDEFNSFAQFRINNLINNVIPSPFGGFFMAGYVDSIKSVGMFDERFKPYFYEDADLMLRLHMQGFTFVHALNSIVYHMGSLTSRASSESQVAMQTTNEIFIKKWKCPWEYARKYTLENGIAYKTVSFTIKQTNCPTNLQNYFSMISDDNADITIIVDGNKLTQNDFEYLQTLPYLLSSIEDEGTYEVGNLIIRYENREK